VLGAKSLEELQEQLNNLDLTVDEATEVMQQAFVVAELTGQHEVIEESE
jgi:hypothetical protein